MHRLWSGRGCNLNSDVKTSKRLTGRFPATPGNVQTRSFQDEDSLKVLLNHPCNWSVLFLYFVFGYLAQKKKKSSFFIMKWSTQYRLLNSMPLQEPFPSASCGFDSLRLHRPSRMAKKSGLLQSLWFPSHWNCWGRYHHAKWALGAKKEKPTLCRFICKYLKYFLNTFILYLYSSFI